MISVSGADQAVGLQVQNGEIKCTGIDTNRETARRLAKHMYEPVRAFDTGRWLRDHEGEWILKKLKVESFSVLATEDLNDAIDQMRQIEGSDWKDLADPIGALKALSEWSVDPY